MVWQKGMVIIIMNRLTVRKPKIRFRKKRLLIINTILSIGLALAILGGFFLGYLYITKLRKNLFSKKIIFSNNYAVAKNKNSSEYNKYLGGADPYNYCMQLNLYFSQAFYDICIAEGNNTETDLRNVTECDFEKYISDLWNIAKASDKDELVDALSLSICEDYGIDTDLFYVISRAIKLVLRIADVKVSSVCQLPDYPNGCEAASAVSMLNTAGIHVSLSDFVEKYLPKSDVRISFGCMYGPDPKEFYAGNPDAGQGGWGCWSPVIVKGVNNIPTELRKKYSAVNLTGTEISGFINYLCMDIPVAIWITSDFKPADEYYQWQSYDKTQTFLYPLKQHCVVLCGVTPDENGVGNIYRYLDPLTGKIAEIDGETLEASYDSMGMQAVAVIPDQYIGCDIFSNEYTSISYVEIIG